MNSTALQHLQALGVKVIAPDEARAAYPEHPQPTEEEFAKIREAALKQAQKEGAERFSARHSKPNRLARRKANATARKAKFQKMLKAAYRAAVVKTNALIQAADVVLENETALD